MIRILGMSHAISVLRAIDPGFSVTHSNWNVANPQLAWNRLGAHATASLGTEASAFLISPAMGWHAELQPGPDGHVLAATTGFWEVVAQLRDPAETQALVSFFGGNEHAMLSLVEHETPYDFSEPGDPRFPLLAGRQPIARAAVVEVLRRRMHGTLAMLTAVRHAHPKLRIIHVMPPPPIASEQTIRHDMEAYFTSSLATLGVTPLSVRMKVYRAYCETLAADCGRLGAETLAAPVQALSTEGALAEGYTLGCTHGNEAYGQLVAQQLQLLLKA